MSPLVRNEPKGVGIADASGTINVNPHYEELTVKSAAALAVGDIVSWSGTADDGVTVLDSTAALPVAGLVLEAASGAGEYIRIQTRGLNRGIITTDGNVDAGDLLVPGAAIALGVAAGAITTANAFLVFGVALADDATTTNAVGTVMLDCFGS